MTTPNLTPYQQEIVDKIRAMQNLTKASGMRTTRSQTELLERLNAEDLSQVSLVLYSGNANTFAPRRETPYAK